MAQPIPMKQTPEDKEVGDKAYKSSKGKVQEYLKRMTNVDDDRLAAVDELKEICAEAKANGYSAKALRQILKDSRKDKGDFLNDQAILDLYRDAVGLT